MPTPPYAKILVSVNSGANQSGGIEVPSAATLRFRGESTVGWLRQRWEIVDYPEGWATPAGWTLDGSTGVIYSLAVEPDDITLPAAASLWGKWFPILKVNEQLDDDQNRIGELYDDTTVISMLSPNGQRDTAGRETSQFCPTGPLKRKNWLRDYQRNLRAIEALLAAVAIPDADASTKGKVQLAGDLAGTGGAAAAPRVSGITGVAGVAEVNAHTFEHTPNEEQLQTELQVNVRTPSDTPALLLDYDTSDDRCYVIKGFIVAQSADLAEYGYWNIDVFCKNDSGTLTVETASPITEEENNTSTPTLALAANGDDIELTATGVSGVPMRWSGRLLVHEIISVPDV